MRKYRRLWAGMTITAVLILNYTLIGMQLFSKASLLEGHYKGILIKQAKSGKMAQNAADDYMLEILRKEHAAVDRRILILNCVSLSLFIAAVSWTAFGIFAARKE